MPYSDAPTVRQPRYRDRPGTRRSGWPAGRTGRLVLAVLSAVVLLGTGYGWSTVTGLTSGLSTADVIDPAAQGTTGPQNILLVGTDSRTDAKGNPLPGAELAALHAGSAKDGENGTDSIILIHIPAGGRGAVGFSIPRDSYVDLAGDFGVHKINSAYSRGVAAARGRLRDQGVRGPDLVLRSDQAGAKSTIATVEQLTGLTVNHYAAVNLVGFYDISKAIGGVQVCVRRATSDPNSGAHFHAGTQQVQGARALAYVRQRHGLPGGDLDRVKRQQAFLASMAHKVLSAGVLANPGRLHSLIAAIQKSVTLDRGWDILSFAQQLQGISAGAIRFFTIPTQNPDLSTPDGSAVEVDPDQARSFVAAHVEQVDHPAPPARPTSHRPAPPTKPNSSITTEVYNTTHIQGLAGDVQKSLTDKGFVPGGTGNAAARQDTVIDYAPGDRASAKQVAAALGGGIATTASTSVSTGTVRVYLGANYTGSQGHPTTGTTTTPKKASAITAASADCLY